MVEVPKRVPKKLWDDAVPNKNYIKNAMKTRSNKTWITPVEVIQGSQPKHFSCFCTRQHCLSAHLENTATHEIFQAHRGKDFCCRYLRRPVSILNKTYSKNTVSYNETIVARFRTSDRLDPSIHVELLILRFEYFNYDISTFHEQHFGPLHFLSKNNGLNGRRTHIDVQSRMTLNDSKRQEVWSRGIASECYVAHDVTLALGKFNVNSFEKVWVSARSA